MQINDIRLVDGFRPILSEHVLENHGIVKQYIDGRYCLFSVKTQKIIAPCEWDSKRGGYIVKLKLSNSKRNFSDVCRNLKIFSDRNSNSHLGVITQQPFRDQFGQRIDLSSQPIEVQKFCTWHLRLGHCSASVIAQSHSLSDDVRAGARKFLTQGYKCMTCETCKLQERPIGPSKTIVSEKADQFWEQQINQASLRSGSGVSLHLDI